MINDFTFSISLYFFNTLEVFLENNDWIDYLLKTFIFGGIHFLYVDELRLELYFNGYIFFRYLRQPKELYWVILIHQKSMLEFPFLLFVSL